GTLGGGDLTTLRAGEVLFALPISLQTMGRANVREGPGAAFHVVFTLDAGTNVTGRSYADQWVRVTDESGRTGWIYYGLVGRPACPPGGPPRAGSRGTLRRRSARRSPLRASAPATPSRP